MFDPFWIWSVAQRLELSNKKRSCLNRFQRKNFKMISKMMKTRKKIKKRRIRQKLKHWSKNKCREEQRMGLSRLKYKFWEMSLLHKIWNVPLNTMRVSSRMKSIREWRSLSTWEKAKFNFQFSKINHWNWIVKRRKFRKDSL